MFSRKGYLELLTQPSMLTQCRPFRRRVVAGGCGIGSPGGRGETQSNGPPGWQIVLSSRLGCLHCVLAAGGEGKAGAGAETFVEYSV